jgi:DNA-binding NarL/FixJ family response regulator
MDGESRRRIIIADDQSSVRASLRLLLEQRTDALVVGEAADALGLILVLEKTPADILLLDWELPGLPSAHLLRLLRFDQPSLPIIAMSVRPEARQEALHAGAAAFLSKSAPPEVVLATLAAVPPAPPHLVTQPG